MMNKPKGYVSPLDRAKDPAVRRRIDEKKREIYLSTLLIEEMKNHKLSVRQLAQRAKVSATTIQSICAAAKNCQNLIVNVDADSGLASLWDYRPAFGLTEVMSISHGSFSQSVPRLPAAGSERHFEGLFPKRTNPEHRKAKYVPLIIYLFHHLIIRRLSEVSGLVVENDLKVVAFSIKPNLQVPFGHRRTPLFIRSVR